MLDPVDTDDWGVDQEVQGDQRVGGVTGGEEGDPGGDNIPHQQEFEEIQTEQGAQQEQEEKNPDTSH